MTPPGTAALSPAGKTSCQFTTPPILRWHPLRIHRSVIPRTAHWTLVPRARVDILLVTPVPMTIQTPIRNLIPEMRTLNLGPTVDPVQTPRTAMMRTTLVTCSVPKRPTNPLRKTGITGHSPAAIAGPGRRNRTSELLCPPRRTNQIRINWNGRKRNHLPGKAGPQKVPPTRIPKWWIRWPSKLARISSRSSRRKTNQDCQSRPKKSKKDSDREAKEAAWKKEQEEEHRRRKKKKKKEKEAKEWKEREERAAREAKQWAEKEELEADERTAWAKLIHTICNEKYGEELPELQVYHKRYITNNQWVTINLDSHIRYLESVREDRSLYPNRIVMLATQLIEKLKEKNWKAIADQLQAVVDKDFGSHTPQGFPKPEDPVVKPLYFIWCLQRSDGSMIDARDENYGDDQNISLHDLVSQPSMRHLCISRKVTVNNRRLTTPIDAGFCPFCDYHSSCHKMLNNHVRIHLSLSLFCGIDGCFFATSDCKALIQHAITEHPWYQKSKELNPKKGGSG